MFSMAILKNDVIIAYHWPHTNESLWTKNWTFVQPVPNKMLIHLTNTHKVSRESLKRLSLSNIIIDSEALIDSLQIIVERFSIEPIWNFDLFFKCTD